MKIKYFALALALAGASLSSCEYDNYDAPSAEFSGRLVTADGEPFLYDNNRQLFVLYQSGFGKDDVGINMVVDNNGSFRQLLFTGNHYELTLINQALPFDMPDFPRMEDNTGYERIAYDITGNVQKDFVVEPYYEISDFQVNLSENERNIEATFNVTKLKEDAPDIASTKIYVSTSSIVDSGISCMRSRNVSDPTSTAMRASIPLAYYRDKQYYINNFRTYAYVRVAVELDGIPNYFLFSDIKKIENLPVTNLPELPE